jgi:hypothetical protein
MVRISESPAGNCGVFFKKRVVKVGEIMKTGIYF